ncbi:MAG: hypothetical protein M1838_000158 [Thelocarpon superellum]|nr:MAG: hypothetical protein M1838_000158 [Thelocarpon superellum]
MEDLAQETPPEDVFIAPSIDTAQILSGESYTHHSPIPETMVNDMSTECVLGVDEAGRGPVIGPMVYALLYLPLSSHRSLLATTHHFDDSKVLTPQVRSALMQKLCTSDTDLYRDCGWATRVMSARDISAGMLKASGTYNLNAQAMDATIELIQGVLAQGVNVTEIYIDTIGSPHVYQTKLAKIFPTISITVAKKADSLYPCVSAASVCAKVTRDAALEVCYQTYTRRSATASSIAAGDETTEEGWGSGYPSDARCSTWLRRNMNPVFGWGMECRFSWSTAKDMLEPPSSKGGDCVSVDWPDMDDDEDESMRVTDFFAATETTSAAGGRDQAWPPADLARWYGSRVSDEVF